MSAPTGMPVFTAEQLAAASLEQLEQVEANSREHAELLDQMVGALDQHYGHPWTSVVILGDLLEREVLVDLVDADLATLTRVRAERAARARGLTA